MTDEHDDGCGCREYQELSRRDFLQSAAGVAGATAAFTAFPAWLPKVVLAQQQASNRDIIVSVFQRGGVDGLTTCIPFGDQNYYAGRPTIAVPPPDSMSPNRSVALDNFFAFPQGMLGLASAYTSGDLLVVHATGQLNKSRSHFDAQRYMEVGKPVDPSLVSGWLGRHLMTVPPMRADAQLRGIGLASGLPKTLVGGPKTLPIGDPANFNIGGLASTRASRAAVLEANYATTMDPLRTAALDAVNTMDLLASLNVNGYVTQNGAVYPNTGFGRALRSVAVMIKADVGVEAAQVDIGGWDTHAAQDPIAGSMYQSMLDFSNSLGAFWADVIATGYRVTVVSVSEFGRNVRENGSAGTDHGRGTTMFAMGRAIAGGRVLALNWPGLAMDQLEDRQDLRVTVDYRDILAEIVSRRLENDSNLSTVFPGWTPTFRGVTR